MTDIRALIETFCSVSADRRVFLPAAEHDIKCVFKAAHNTIITYFFLDCKSIYFDIIKFCTKNEKTLANASD